MALEQMQGFSNDPNFWHLLSNLSMFISVTFNTSSTSRMDGWMNGVLGHFFALSRLNWAGTTWTNEMKLG